jgi:ABC-2 type transport system ATP-binding protein
MIRAHGLTRIFEAHVAVEDVSLEVQPGEIFGLLGPNGAGKTTTLRMLGGLIMPSAGEAHVAGVPLTRERMDEVRTRVGFLTEAPGLWDRLTVRMNLLVYARLYGVAEPGRAVRDALGMFGLEDRAESLAAQLSKGMKQKVAVARALMHQPPVVLLDEPTSGLDPQTARLVRDLVLELRERGHAIIISTHNLDEAERVSTRIGVLRRTLIAVDTPDALRRRLFGHRLDVRVIREPAKYAEVAVRAGARQPIISDRGFSVQVDGGDAAVAVLVRALVTAGADVVDVSLAQAPLEDVYLTLLGEPVAAIEGES